MQLQLTDPSVLIPHFQILWQYSQLTSWQTNATERAVLKTQIVRCWAPAKLWNNSRSFCCQSKCQDEHATKAFRTVCRARKLQVHLSWSVYFSLFSLQANNQQLWQKHRKYVCEFPFVRLYAAISWIWNWLPSAAVPAICTIENNALLFQEFIHHAVFPTITTINYAFSQFRVPARVPTPVATVCSDSDSPMHPH